MPTSSLSGSGIHVGLTLFRLGFLRVAQLGGGGGGECPRPITLKLLMAVFILEMDNPSRRIICLLFYVSSINTGRTTTSIESASRRRI